MIRTDPTILGLFGDSTDDDSDKVSVASGASDASDGDHWIVPRAPPKVRPPSGAQPRPSHDKKQASVIASKRSSRRRGRRAATEAAAAKPGEDSFECEPSGLSSVVSSAAGLGPPGPLLFLRQRSLSFSGTGKLPVLPQTGAGVNCFGARSYDNTLPAQPPTFVFCYRFDTDNNFVP